jgi:hypothetical protein
MKFKIICVTVFLTGLVFFIASRVVISNPTYNSSQTSNNIQKSYVVHYLVSNSTDGKTITPYEYRVKYVNTNGEWKENRYSFDGKISSQVGTMDGLYLINHGSIQYYGAHDPRMYKTSKEKLMTGPQFTGKGNVAGLEVYIWKEASDSEETEMSFAVETGLIPLKRVITFKDKDGNVQYPQIIEALRVDFRDVSETEYKLPDNLPIEVEAAEHRIEALKKAGQNEKAEQSQKALDRHKSSATHQKK